MELPHLGKHCSEDSCRRLDFLPVKCDGCSKVFCGDHYTYTGHNCPNAYKKNVQVPVCPLCSAPIPGKVDELPDIRVSRHIDNDCKSDTALSRRQKVYSNRCTLKTCKKKEMIPLICDKCNLNFCLKHRHPQDHECSKIGEKSVGRPGQAAITRVSSQGQGDKRSGASAQAYRPSVLQGNVTEDEALQLALQASLGNPTAVSSRTLSSQEQEDFLLAKAIAESEREAGVAGGASRRSQRKEPSCQIS